MVTTGHVTGLEKTLLGVGGGGGGGGGEVGGRGGQVVGCQIVAQMSREVRS